MAWSVPNKRPPVQEKIASAWICVLILLLCLLATSGWLLLAKMESWSTFLHSAQAIQISGIGFGVAMLALTVYLMPIEWNNAIYANWMNWRAEKMLRWQESRRKSAYLGASAILSSDTQLVDKVAGLELSPAEYVMPPLLFAERNIAPGCERFQAIYEALLIMMRSELLKNSLPLNVYIQTASQNEALSLFELAEIWQRMGIPAYNDICYCSGMDYNALMNKVSESTEASLLMSISFYSKDSLQPIPELGSALLFSPRFTDDSSALRIFGAMPCHLSTLKTDFEQMAWVQQRPASSIKTLIFNGIEKRAAAMLAVQLADSGVSLHQDSKNLGMADFASYCADYQGLAPSFMLASAHQLASLDYGNQWLLFKSDGGIYLQTVGKNTADSYSDDSYPNDSYPDDSAQSSYTSINHFPFSFIALSAFIVSVAVFILNSANNNSTDSAKIFIVLAIVFSGLFSLLLFVRQISIERIWRARFIKACHE